MLRISQLTVCSGIVVEATNSSDEDARADRHLHGTRAADQLERLVDQDRHEEDVDDIPPRERGPMDEGAQCVRHGSVNSTLLAGAPSQGPGRLVQAVRAARMESATRATSFVAGGSLRNRRGRPWRAGCYSRRRARRGAGAGRHRSPEADTPRRVATRCAPPGSSPPPGRPGSWPRPRAPGRCGRRPGCRPSRPPPCPIPARRARARRARPAGTTCGTDRAGAGRSSAAKTASSSRARRRRLCSARLAKPMPGIEDDALAGHAGRLAPARRRPELAPDFAHHLRVPGAGVHVVRTTALVHQHERRAGAPRPPPPAPDRPAGR